LRCSELAPPLIGVAPTNVHKFLWAFVYFWEIPRTPRRWMNNVLGTIVPNFVLVETFVCLEFRHIVVGDILPVFRSEN
jgi:hypothetical protein